MKLPEMDSRFRVETLVQTPVPHQLIYAMMHQDYSECFVYDEFHWKLNEGITNRKGFSPDVNIEEECGRRIVRNLLHGGKGHFGCLEHPSISFNVGWFPHSVMQQVRTHRVGMTFDVQSFRYTGDRITQVVDVSVFRDDVKIQGDLSDEDFNQLTVKVAEGEKDVEDVFYLRPVGHYNDRQGNKYYYSPEWRDEHKTKCIESCKQYTLDLRRRMAPEHARGVIPFDVRQCWGMTMNARSFMHLMDLRAKADAQLECQFLCDILIQPFIDWAPALGEWYRDSRWGKARLAP